MTQESSTPHLNTELTRLMHLAVGARQAVERGDAGAVETLKMLDLLTRIWQRMAVLQKLTHQLDRAEQASLLDAFFAPDAAGEVRRDDQ